MLGATPAVFPGSGQGTSTASLVTAPASVFSGDELLMLTDGEAPPLTGIRVEISGNAAGAFGGAPFGGSLGVSGRVALLALGATFIEVPFATAMGARLGIGGKGVTGPTSLPVSVEFHQWATGAYTSVSGGVFQGLDSRTPGGAGQITLVSPTRVTAMLPGSDLTFSVVSTLTFQLVPEPATPLLLGVGVAALAWQGRRRARASRP